MTVTEEVAAAQQAERDRIAPQKSLSDFDGTKAEVLEAKSLWVKTHGFDAWEKMVLRSNQAKK